MSYQDLGEEVCFGKFREEVLAMDLDIEKEKRLLEMGEQMVKDRYLNMLRATWEREKEYGTYYSKMGLLGSMEVVQPWAAWDINEAKSGLYKYDVAIAEDIIEWAIKNNAFIKPTKNDGYKIIK